jgi:hypothetical protein
VWLRQRGPSGAPARGGLWLLRELLACRGRPCARRSLRNVLATLGPLGRSASESFTGARENASWVGGGVRSAKRKTAITPLGAPSEGGLRGLTRSVLRGRICKSPVRRTPASCFSAARVVLRVSVQHQHQHQRQRERPRPRSASASAPAFSVSEKHRGDGVAPRGRCQSCGSRARPAADAPVAQLDRAAAF